MKPLDPLAEERPFARRWLRPAAALVGGASIAMLVASSPAVAGHSPVADHSPVGGASPPARSIEIEIEGPVVRSASGAVVNLPVKVVCSAGPDAQLWGDLTQRGIAVVHTGYGQATAPCDDKVHLVKLPIVANRVAFRPGKAFARVQAYQFDSNLSDADQEEVNIRLR